MQKIRLVVVGSLKEDYWKAAINEYKKRLSRFCLFEIIEVEEKSKLSGRKKIDAECQLILTQTKGKTILFDLCGRNCTSEDFTKLMNNYQTEQTITIIIGGSNGVNQELISTASEIVKFGDATFPHQLFRVMAVEQIYRAFTINANLPYHK